MLTCVLGAAKSRIDVAIQGKVPDAIGATHEAWKNEPRTATQHPLL